MTRDEAEQLVKLYRMAVITYSELASRRGEERRLPSAADREMTLFAAIVDALTDRK